MKQIATALVKAQKAFGPALKTSTNPHFRSRYADLSACVEAVMDGLNANGIALVQQLSECNDGVIVETIFVHESGESFNCGKLHIPAVKHDAQGFGSALTYARRYSLMSACGIAPEDDDGNAASKGNTAKKELVSIPINEYLMADHLLAIEACTTEDDLRKAFTNAWKDSASSKEWQAKVTAKKNEVKTRLESK
jgi:hypothetical protein